MSIKHYNGIRFRERTMESVHRMMLKIGPEMRKYVLETCRANILSRAVMIYDKNVLEPVQGLDVMYEALKAFRDEAEKANQGAEASSYDFSFSVTVAPFEGRMYGIHHGSRRLTERFLELSKAEEYHYQDQTDRPDEVSARAWNQRAHVWWGIFDKSPGWVPSEIGPAYKLVPETPTWMYGDRDEFKAQFTTVGPERFKAVAFNQVMDQVMKGEFAEASGIQSPGKDVPLTKIGTLYFNALKWVKTPEGQKLVEEEIAALAKKLPAKVTFEMLWKEEKKEK